MTKEEVQQTVPITLTVQELTNMTKDQYGNTNITKFFKKDNR